MALVTAYLARTTQAYAGRSIASGVRVAFDRLRAVIRVSIDAMTDAQELRRDMARKHPFIDM